MRKVWLLLAYLIYHRRSRATQQTFLTLLQSTGESDDPAARLKALLYRVRSQLDKLGDGAGHDLILRKDGSYTHGKDIIRYNPDTLQFDITLNGISSTAEMSNNGESLYMEFSDGWAIEFGKYGVFTMEIGDILINSNYAITPLDFEAMGCRFEKAMPMTSEPVYDEYNNCIGQYHTLATASGEIIEVWETWNDPEDQPLNTGRHEPKPITEGIPLTINANFDYLFVNDEGAYLLNPEVLFTIKNGYEDFYRLHFARLLQDISDENAAMRGTVPSIILYIFFYALGALQWLKPQETALFGSRWQFKNVPELSDEGILAVRFGAVIVMILGVAMLFLPAFA